MNRIVMWALLPAALSMPLPGAQRQTAASQLPDTPGHDTVKKICSACHPAEIVMSKGLSRDQWGAIVSNMIGRGAKGTDEEFAEVVDYLSKNFPPSAATAGTSAVPIPKKKAGGLLSQAGANDKQQVDEVAANRGKATYAAQCITCHGSKGRGTEQGPDLVRSLVVLHDRYGSEIGPYLAKGHPMQSKMPSSSLTKAQVEDLSHFLHQKVEDTLRTGPYNSVLNVLTGDPKAGEQYFNGAGKCSTCHSVTGDLKGIATRYDPPTLQLKTVFPQTVAFGRRRKNAAGKKPVTVSVTPPGGQTVEGELLEMDDFNVSLRDASGEYRTVPLTPGTKLEKHDPYAAHEALLDQYTDRDIHNVVAYLETLK